MSELSLKKLLSITQQRERKAKEKTSARSPENEMDLESIASEADVPLYRLREVIADYNKNNLAKEELGLAYNLWERGKMQLASSAKVVLSLARKAVFPLVLSIGITAGLLTAGFSITKLYNSAFLSNSAKAQATYQQVQAGKLKPAEAEFEYLAFMSHAFCETYDLSYWNANYFGERARQYLDVLKQTIYSVVEGITALEILDNSEFGGYGFSRSGSTNGELAPLTDYLLLCSERGKSGEEMLTILVRASGNKYARDIKTTLQVATAIAQGKI